MTVNRRPHSTSDNREARLWRVVRALVVTFAAAVLVAGSVFYGWVYLLDFQEIDTTTKLDAKPLDLVKPSFGVVAGAGRTRCPGRRLPPSARRRSRCSPGSNPAPHRTFLRGRRQTRLRLPGDPARWRPRPGRSRRRRPRQQPAPDPSTSLAPTSSSLPPAPGDDPAHPGEHHRYPALRKVRHTILRLIGDHCRRPQGSPPLDPIRPAATAHPDDLHLPDRAAWCPESEVLLLVGYESSGSEDSAVVGD